MPKELTKTDAIAGTIVGDERRRSPRYPFIAYAEVTDMKPPHVRVKARISDLGREGCYVDTISPFAVGTNVLIRIMKNDKVCSPKALVLYSTVRMGMGVEFTSVAPGEVPVLERWLAELSGELPAEELSGELAMDGQFQDHGDEQDEVREFFGNLTSALVRKRILSEVEGNAMLDKLSRNKKLY
jgi:PilZ domain